MAERFFVGLSPVITSTGVRELSLIRSSRIFAVSLNQIQNTTSGVLAHELAKVHRLRFSRRKVLTLLSEKCKLRSGWGNSIFNNLIQSGHRARNWNEISSRRCAGKGIFICARDRL